MIPFLYSKQGVLTKEVCEKLIDAFEISSLKKEVDTRLSDGSIHKKSTDVYFEDSVKSEWYTKELELWYPSVYEVATVTDTALSEYYLFYPELNLVPPIQAERFNMQKYGPGEGFAGWHFENSYGNESRVLVWMIYLNDVKDGGTEFKYQNHTERAELGKLLIWPGDWTFTHRGQISLTETKYILTGWYEKVVN